MALNHVAGENNSGKVGQKRQIFTFFVEDMMFGLDIENVLMLGQEVNDVQRLPVEERGFCGVVKYQGEVVPVLDYAHRIGVPSGMDCKTDLLETLTAREKEHIEWLNELEKAIKTGSTFAETTNPDQCAFGKWYNNFETRDETLKELLVAFEEPHRTIHGLAEKLLSLRDNGKEAEALEALATARATTLSRLIALFSRARDQIQSGMRQVLLFVTLDGKTPRYALIIDEINDVINYSPSEFQSSRSGALGLINKIEHVLDGIYTRKDLPDCLYFDINKMTDIDELMKKVS
ncbi:MAG: CZB domain-containing protein [Gammaproteobacteria bacterium]|nr:CZB domain-containing protein [Gammaproteobacteria bacterium]